MAEKNVTEVLVTPVVPTVVDNQELTVYVPVASSDVAGVVKPDAGDFSVADDGKLSLIKGSSYDSLQDALDTVAQVAQDVSTLKVDKQNRVDNGLETESKLVVGAINELWQTLQDVDIRNVVTKSTTDLVNYYLKSQTYSQDEVNQLIANVKTTVFLVVDELPVEGEDNIIYLKPKTSNNFVSVADDGPFSLTFDDNVADYIKVNGATVASGYQLNDGDVITVVGFGIGQQPYQSFAMPIVNGATYKTSQGITLANTNINVSGYDTANELVTLTINFVILNMQDTYDEYIWVVDPNTDPPVKKWEHIGTTAIDLSNYPTIDQMNTAIATAISQAQSGITALDLSYGNVEVTYNTTDGALLSSTARITTGDTYSDVPIESEMPIFGDNNDITIDANAAGTGLVIKGAEVLELSVAPGATNGTLTQLQLDFLQNKKGNMIMVEHELYRLGSDGYNPGFLTYYHVGITGTTQHIKTLSITLSTRAWTIVVEEIIYGKSGSVTLATADWNTTTKDCLKEFGDLRSTDTIFLTPRYRNDKKNATSFELFASTLNEVGEQLPAGKVRFSVESIPNAAIVLDYYIARGE